MGRGIGFRAPFWKQRRMRMPKAQMKLSAFSALSSAARVSSAFCFVRAARIFGQISAMSEASANRLVMLAVLRVYDAALAVDEEVGWIASDSAIARQHASREACAKSADVFAHHGDREHTGPACVDPYILKMRSGLGTSAKGGKSIFAACSFSAGE